MNPFTYRCPFCGHLATITDQNYSTSQSEFNDGNRYGAQVVRFTAITCPNPDCREYRLSVSLHDRRYPSGSPPQTLNAKNSWQLLPQSNAKVLPEYVPAPIVQDYKEACAIQFASPKASATLARRCLQGIIRDFWGITKARLIDEIEAIQDKIDPLTWTAIDSVRKIGNIGAHMEKDINVILDVDPDEAGLLIGLIETVIQDWYIVRYEREERLKTVIAMSQTKEAQRHSVSDRSVTSSEPQGTRNDPTLEHPDAGGI
jgi:hypothetical protein